MHWTRKLQPVALGLILAWSPQSAGSEARNLSKQYERVDPNKPVLCLLPGRVRQLGGRLTYLEPRKPQELTASECQIRGGEYTLYDRANYETALAVWREAAETGDATAQLYVGEIYEKGWVGGPDYAQAARWYQLAADQGDVRAYRRLAYFYEQGLGVEPDAERALALWRDALGFEEGLVLASELEAARSEAQRRIDGLLAQLESQTQKTLQLQRALAAQEERLLAQRQAVTEAEAETRALEAALEEAVASAADTGRVRELEQALAERESRLQEQQTSIELLEAEVDAQRAQVVASARQADIRESQLTKARAQLEAEVTKREALLAQLAAQQQALASVETELENARALLAESQAKERSLLASLGEGSASASAEAERALAEARELIARKEAQIASLELTLTSDREQFQIQLATANVRESELQDALATSEGEVARLAAALAERESLLDSERARLAELQTALANARIDRAMILEDLAAREAAGAGGTEVEELKARLRAQQDQIALLESQNDQMQASWQELATERDQMRQELAGQSDWFKAEMARERMRMIELQRERDNFQLALEQANFSVRRLTTDVDRLQQEITRARQGNAAETRLLEDQLRQAQQELSQRIAAVNDLERQNARLSMELQFQGQQTQTRMLAMRGLEPAPELQPLELPDGLQLGKYRALILANYDYQFIPDLESPRNDAAELKSLLERNYGFEVTLGINLNYSEMLAALSEMKSYGEDDFVLVYYAGHGKMDEEGDGYWLPTDYIEGRPMASSAISSNDITQYMERSPARHVLLVADSCYAGALLRNANALPQFKASPSVLVRHWINNRSRTVLTSGGLQPVLDEGMDRRHSVFANALLSVLASTRGPINGPMLHAAVQSKVQIDAAGLGYMDQVPQFAAIEDAGHANGQFVFVPRGSGPISGD